MRVGVLNVRSLVELFVVVDAERQSSLPYRGPCPRYLWRKESCGDRGHDRVGTEVVILRNLNVQCIAWNLGVVPVNRKCDRRVAEHAEVKRVVRVRRGV